MFNHIINTPR